MPSQETYDLTFLNIAHEFTLLSHCVSHRVGCVIVRDGRILSTGYNGTLPGYVNCDEVFPNYTAEDRQKHFEWSSLHELHGEQNAIAHAAKNGIKLDGATLYCTLEPCMHCVKLIIPTGIKRIVYGSYYDKNQNREATAEMLKSCGISIERFEREDEE